MTLTFPEVDGPSDAELINNVRDLDADEKRILGRLKKQLTQARNANRNKYAYYETRQKVEQLDIAIPPQLRDTLVICGWPETVVDVLDERIDLLGWTTADGNDRGLNDIAEDNNLSMEASRTTNDSLIAGVSFATVGTGDEDEGEPPVLITGESPNSATVIWDYRKRRSEAGLSETRNERNQLIMQSLYLPNRTILFEADPQNGGKMEVVNIDEHNLGRTLMTRLLTRDRASNVNGRSEITRAVRYYTDAAIRTMLGMEVNREFYTTPMRAMLDVDPTTLGFRDDMTDAEKSHLGWKLMMGHINIVPPQGDPNTPLQQPKPSIHQFDPAPPSPYVEQIKAYSIMLSGQTGMPPEMFGFVTDNPTSGDAILKGEYRLVRRAERRIMSYSPSWKEVALLAMLCRDKKRADRLSLDDLRQIRPLWRNPAIPTRAAQADEAQKLIAAKVLPPNSSVTYQRLDISEQDQRTLERDWRKQEAKEQAQMAREQANQVNTAVAVTKAKAVAAPTSGEPGRPNIGGGPSS